MGVCAVGVEASPAVQKVYICLSSTGDRADGVVCLAVAGWTTNPVCVPRLPTVPQSNRMNRVSYKQ